VDESTYGESPLRSVNKTSDGNRPSRRSIETNSRVEKRRKLRIEHRNEQITQFWRVFIFSSITYGLGALVITNGWSLIHTAQIQVKGSPKINANSIVIASGLIFPKPLFEINPRQLKTNLLKELPIRSIQMERRLIPPRLEIEITARKPIAFADRRGLEGKEKGMLDKKGYWMPIKMANKTELPKKDVYVEGWRATHRDWISIILNNQEKIGSKLKRIIVSPNGELSLQTKSFEVVQLGASSFYIKEQIKALYQLNNNLPASFVNKKGTILDIRDPSKPELQIKNNGF